MGVPGLLNYILEHRDCCVEYVDLIERARLQQPSASIDLLVDFHAFANYLLGKFNASLSMANPYASVQGGEYGLLDAWLRQLIADLKAVGVNLIWHVDAARGCCGKTDAQRSRLWMHRLRQEVQRRTEVLRWCSGYASDSGVAPDPSIRPVCLEQQMLASIRASGCPVHQAVRGEADYNLAQALLTNRQALAVLSNDSDLCVFRDSVLLPTELFDLHGDLGLGKEPQSISQGPLTERPLRLVVGLVSGPNVLKLLGFDRWDLLLDLSVIMGNDFTGPLLGNRDRLGNQLGVRDAVAVCKPEQSGDAGGPRLMLADIAAWLRSINGLANSREFERRLANDQRLRSAVEHSRQFYCLMLVEGVESLSSSVSRCPLEAHL
uniref:XPG_I_2 domain-containing protein n=1 Tax=Macrostomum lignano TaxID=282301 RepID=A0A1I8H4T0_9PLAT